MVHYSSWLLLQKPNTAKSQGLLPARGWFAARELFVSKSCCQQSEGGSCRSRLHPRRSLQELPEALLDCHRGFYKACYKGRDRGYHEGYCHYICCNKGCLEGLGLTTWNAQLCVIWAHWDTKLWLPKLNPSLHQSRASQVKIDRCDVRIANWAWIIFPQLENAPKTATWARTKQDGGAATAGTRSRKSTRHAAILPQAYCMARAGARQGITLVL